MTVDEGPSTYRPTSLRLGYVPVVVCLAALGSWLVQDSWTGGRPGTAIAVGAVWVAAAVVATELLWRPAVVTRPAGVILVNPFRTVFVPWESLVGTEPGDGLRLLTTDRCLRSWAASGGLRAGGSASAGRAVLADNPMGAPFGMGSAAGPGLRSVLAGGARQGDSPAKILVDRAWQSWQSVRHEGRRDGAAVTVTWHRLPAAVLVAATVSGVIAAVLAR